MQLKPQAPTNLSPGDIIRAEALNAAAANSNRAANAATAQGFKLEDGGGSAVVPISGPIVVRAIRDIVPGNYADAPEINPVESYSAIVQVWSDEGNGWTDSEGKYVDLQTFELPIRLNQIVRASFNAARRCYLPFEPDHSAIVEVVSCTKNVDGFYNAYLVEWQNDEQSWLRTRLVHALDGNDDAFSTNFADDVEVVDIETECDCEEEGGGGETPAAHAESHQVGGDDPLCLDLIAVCGDVDFSGFKLINVATPEDGGDGVNKSYVDSLIVFYAQPLDDDLTAIAALTTDPYGRGFLELVDAEDARAYIGLSVEEIEDLVGAMPADSADLDFSYDDGTGTFTAVLKTNGVTPGTYPKVTVDGTGRVTAGAALSGGDIPDLSGTYSVTGHTHTFASLTSKPTTLSGYGITDGQPLDGDLTSLAGATGTNTIYYRSAANTWSAVTIGSNLTFSGGTLAATGGGSGTVTSVALTVPGFLSVAGSPVTTSGTLAVSLATQVKNKVFAGPDTGADAAPTFRLLVWADIPLISALTAVTVADGDTFAFSDTSDSEALKKATAANLSVYFNADVHLRDEKSGGTQSGTFTGSTAGSPSFSTRTLNTEVSDPSNLCSLSSNQFTLAAGTYDIFAISPVCGVDNHQSRLYNATGTTALLTGSAGYASSVSQPNDYSYIVGRFTVAASQALEIQHSCLTTCATFGFGARSNRGSNPEVFGQVWLRKVG